MRSSKTASNALDPYECSILSHKHCPLPEPEISINSVEHGNFFKVPFPLSKVYGKMIQLSYSEHHEPGLS